MNNLAAIASLVVALLFMIASKVHGSTPYYYPLTVNNFTGTNLTISGLHASASLPPGRQSIMWLEEEGQPVIGNAETIIPTLPTLDSQEQEAGQSRLVTEVTVGLDTYKVIERYRMEYADNYKPHVLYGGNYFGWTDFVLPDKNWTSEKSPTWWLSAGLFSGFAVFVTSRIARSIGSTLSNSGAIE